MIPQKLLDEYRLIESQTAHVVLPDRTLLQFSGPDRRKFLHNFCTADINAMQQGDVREAFVLDSRGRTLAFGHVLDIDNDLWLTLPDSKFAGPLCTHFEKYVIREKVQITDVSNLFAAVLVFGGNVQLSPETAIELPVGNAKDFQFNKTPVIVAHDEFAGPALLFLVVRDEQTSLCTALASQGLVPCSMAALEMWRVEHLTPWYGCEITEVNLPQEVRRDQTAISFKKGCYLGQETVAKIDAIGHVNRFLVGLKIQTAQPPKPGDDVLYDQTKVGEVRTIAFSPQHNAWLVLAYVKRQHADEGTTVAIGGEPATVVRLPSP